MAIENQPQQSSNSAMEEEPKDRCVRLEGIELTIGMGLSAGEYAELLLNYLIQQQPIKAKYCYIRAMEKFERDQQLLKLIWTFGEYVCKQNFARALKVCNTVTVDQMLQPYVDELKRRLTASQLFDVLKSYSTISAVKLAQLLGMDDPTNAVLQELIQKCQWTVIGDGFVVLTRTEEFERAIESLHDPKFGPMPNCKKAENQAVAEDDSSSSSDKMRNIDNLKSLVDSSTFFDAMSVPAAVEGSASATNVQQNSNNPNN